LQPRKQEWRHLEHLQTVDSLEVCRMAGVHRKTSVQATGEVHRVIIPTAAKTRTNGHTNSRPGTADAVPGQ